MSEKEVLPPTRRTLLRVKRRRSEVAWPGIALENDVPAATQAKRAKVDFALLTRQNSPALEGHPLKTKASAEQELLRKGVGLTAGQVRQQIRANRGERARKNRLKVVTASREASATNIIDLEPEKAAGQPEALACNGQVMAREESDFVYDIYEMTDVVDIDDAFFERMASIQAFALDAHDLMEEYRDQDDDLLEDSEDSNDEGNWRNDYPDEEEYAELAYDSDLAMGGLNLGDGSNSEASEDESALVYSRQMRRRDENLHGASYARYKQRIMKDLRDSDASDEEDINEVDEY